MVSSLLALAWPARCPGCGRRAEPVCRPCLASVRAAPVVAAPEGLDAWAAAFSYEGVVRELVAQVKYRNARAALDWLADAAAAVAPLPAPALMPVGTVSDDETPGPSDLVVTWVPTVVNRRRDRGFDQAELLAGRVARRLGRPCRRLLWRGAGPAQTGRARAERLSGPVLAARAGSPRAGSPRAVLVVDDVATTGASLRAAASALRTAGTGWIGAVTVARTPNPSSTRGPNRPNTCP